MKLLLKFFALSVIVMNIQLAGYAKGGILESLDDELTSLVDKTDPYLVTVKGEGQWKNLVATGIVFNKAGYVITTSHVYDAKNHEVMFNDGVSYPAEKVGVDHQTGLAVLKIESDSLGVPALGNSAELEMGSWILVVGNSYGTPATVNFGIFEGKTEEDFLELGVSAPPGSSGGAVLDTGGNVVGILVARESSSLAEAGDIARNLYSAARNLRIFNLMGDSESKAVAVPIEVASDIATQLIENGKVERGFLGISQRNLSADELERNDIDHGVVVTDVVGDSPAEKAGIEKKDIITAVDGKSINRTSELFTLIRSHKPGDEVSITYLRDGETLSAKVVLAGAKDNMALGGWEFRESQPGMNVGKLLDTSKSTDLEKELARLDRKLSELKRQLDSLRHELSD